MDGNLVLESLPEIGIGLVGFTGVVAVLGRRAQGQWTRSERLRFYLLLHMSTLVVFVPLVPAWLSKLDLSAGAIWQISAGLLALAHGSSFAWALLSGMPETPSPRQVALRRYMFPISVVGAFVILAEVLVAFGLLRARAEFIFTGALMWVLFLAVVSFVTLLFPDPQEPSGGSA